jgi:hypothetical protein
MRFKVLFHNDGSGNSMLEGFLTSEECVEIQQPNSPTHASTHSHTHSTTLLQPLRNLDGVKEIIFTAESAEIASRWITALQCVSGAGQYVPAY